MCHATASGSVTDRLFSRAALCDVTKKISTGCMVTPRPDRTMSSVHCVSLCAQDDQCLGASLNLSSAVCFHHRTCAYTQRTCTVPDHEFRFYLKLSWTSPCDHQGKFTASEGRCECVGGWVGARCERWPFSCDELLTHGYSNTSLWLTLDPYGDGSLLTQALCQVRGQSDVITYVFRNSGSATNLHNRSLTDYVTGYKMDVHDFWLGLDAISALSGSGRKLCLQVVLDDVTGKQHQQQWLYSLYDDFRMSGPSSGYTYAFRSFSSGMSGTLGVTPSMNLLDCLGHTAGIPFSTWDRDNDGNATANCAKEQGVGWWFPPSCHLPCNPLGPLAPRHNPPHPPTALALPGLDMADKMVARYFRRVEAYFVSS
ncbi:uncharacterized protein LOC118478610 [Aplysia californica]|uniref:Uncharacterized protein LOC118478610 n=1 Tax=Aplysia californica TaxID=6500 RepID=A0ABM1W188_APLCA|nr:uncharacterized protein LOC118478610 [Aplysia californica]